MASLCLDDKYVQVFIRPRLLGANKELTSPGPAAPCDGNDGEIPAQEMVVMVPGATLS